MLGRADIILSFCIVEIKQYIFVMECPERPDFISFHFTILYAKNVFHVNNLFRFIQNEISNSSSIVFSHTQKKMFKNKNIIIL